MNPQISALPDKWKIMKLGEVLSLIKNGLTYRQTKDGIGYPITRIETISEGRIDNTKFGYFNDLSEREILNNKLELGDILFSHINSVEHIAKTAIYEGDPPLLIHGMNLLLFRPNKEKCFPPYFLQYLKWGRTRNRFRSMAKQAVNQASINQTQLQAFNILLPPLLEQRRIAEVLGTVDSTIQKVGEAIEKTGRMKKGLMQRLLMRGIRHERFKESEVGRVPEEWEVARLGDVADDFVGGGTPSTSNPDYWNGKIAWMTSAYIDGKVVTSGQRYITEKGLNESSTHLIPKGNLLVATRVGIGKAATNSIDIAISQDLTGVIIKKDEITADYAYWFLINNSSMLKSLAQGSTIKGILKDDLTNLKLPLPPLPEQRRIAEILSAVDKKLELERRRKEKLERVKKGLMNELLTGRKRVKIEAI
jgi:type I restriction enzyme S subunit